MHARTCTGFRYGKMNRLPRRPESPLFHFSPVHKRTCCCRNAAGNDIIPLPRVKTWLLNKNYCKEYILRAKCVPCIQLSASVLTFPSETRIWKILPMSEHINIHDCYLV